MNKIRTRTRGKYRGQRYPITPKRGIPSPSTQKEVNKGDTVPISVNAYKPETREHSYKDIGLHFNLVILKKGTKLYHRSVYEKLNAFYPQRTCFHDEPIVMRGHVYLFEVLDSIQAKKEERTGEVRVDLGRISPEDIRITYLGTIKGGNKFILDEHDRVIHRFVDVDFHPRYEHLEKYIEEKDQHSHDRSMRKYNYRIVEK